MVFISLSGVGCSPGTHERERAENSVARTLSRLLLDGPQLHASLQTPPVDSIRELPIGLQLPVNPHLSADNEFVQAVARGGSQGRLDGEGIRSALYARYATGDHEVGFYGMEAASPMHAEEREQALREIWAHNGRHGRSRVHRAGLILLVIWHDGVSPECWQAVNEAVQEQMNAFLESDK